MTEPIFEIVSKKRENPQKLKQNGLNPYSNLLQEYMSHSYGYYTELFIKKISQKVQNQHQNLRRFQFRKILREVVHKYLMTDLEVIFLCHFANLHEWNYNHAIIQKSIEQNEASNELNQINKFKLFLYLLCFFVKSYVGSQDQLSALIDFHNQNLPFFSEIYQIWIENNPQKMFQISPRQLNQIYSQHSKNCGQKVHKKDFNQMVDKILDLSTTYSIMPSKQNKQKKSSNKGSKQIIPMNRQRLSRNNIESNLMGLGNNSLRLDLSDWMSNKKQSLLFPNSSNFSGQNLQKQQQSVKQVKQSQKSSGTNPKKISLNKKKKLEKDQVNNLAKAFFRGKDINMSLDDMKKNQGSLRDVLPNSFLDMNIHSSRIQSLPFQYRNNSNIFGPSTLF